MDGMIPGYMGTQEAATKWGYVSVASVLRLLKQGRVPGAFRPPGRPRWLIPEWVEKDHVKSDSWPTTNTDGVPDTAREAAYIAALGGQKLWLFAMGVQPFCLQENEPDVFGAMTDKERYVLSRRSGLSGRQPATLTELSDEMNVTRETIYQMHKTGCSKLRDALLDSPDPMFREGFSL